MEERQVNGDRDSRQADEERRKLQPGHYFSVFSRFWIVALEQTAAG